MKKILMSTLMFASSCLSLMGLPTGVEVMVRGGKSRLTSSYNTRELSDLIKDTEDFTERLMDRASKDYREATDEYLKHDFKISALAHNGDTSLYHYMWHLAERNDAQQAEIDAQRKAINKLRARISKLEGKPKKVALGKRRSRRA